MKKVNAVILAGGNKRLSFKELYNQLIDSVSYGEWYIRRGYKCLKRLKPRKNSFRPENLKGWAAWQSYRLSQYIAYQSKRVMGGIDEEKLPRPMIEYSIKSLLDAKTIDSIFIVGPKNEILTNILSKYSTDSRVNVVQQGRSFGQNVKIGHEAAGSGFSLYLTSDSPTTTSEDIDECVRKSQSVIEDDKSDDKYVAVYPVVKKSILEESKRFIARKYFWMQPDTMVCMDYLNSEDFDDSGRVGFRITSMSFADVTDVPVEQIDLAYSARKMLSPRAIKSIGNFFSWDVISKYWNKNMGMSYIEDDLSKKAFGHRIKLIGLTGAGTSFDVDSVQDVKSIEEIVS